MFAAISTVAWRQLIASLSYSLCPRGQISRAYRQIYLSTRCLPRHHVCCWRASERRSLALLGFELRFVYSLVHVHESKRFHVWGGNSSALLSPRSYACGAGRAALRQDSADCSSWQPKQSRSTIGADLGIKRPLSDRLVFIHQRSGLHICRLNTLFLK